MSNLTDISPFLHKADKRDGTRWANIALEANLESSEDHTLVVTIFSLESSFHKWIPKLTDFLTTGAFIPTDQYAIGFK